MRRAPAVSGHLPANALALAGALMLGFGFWRKTPRWMGLIVFAVGALAGALEVSASGKKADPMTPGTYQYTISANYKATPDAPLGQGVSTNITLTVK
jgi:hypothetical protein